MEEDCDSKQLRLPEEHRALGAKRVGIESSAPAESILVRVTVSQAAPGSSEQQR